MKKKINFLLAGLLLIISFSAVADEMRFQKPYIQLNGGISAGDGLGVSAAAGVDLNKLLAVEVGSVANFNIFGKDYDIVYLGLLAKHALSDKMVLAGKAGITNWNSTSHPVGLAPEKNGVSGMVGLDLKYDFNQSFAAVFSAEYFFKVEAAPIMLGLRYTF